MTKEGIDHLQSLLRENIDNKFKEALAWAKKYEVYSVGEYDSRQIAGVVFLYESIQTRSVCLLKIGGWLCNLYYAERNLLALWINRTFLFEKDDVYNAFNTWMKMESRWSSLGVDLAKIMSPKYEIMQQAAYHGNDDLIKWMISIGIDVDSKDSHRRTALHIAAKKGRMATVTCLLKNKASIFVLDYKHSRPIDVAFDKRQTAIYDIMRPYLVKFATSKRPGAVLGSKQPGDVCPAYRLKELHNSKNIDLDTNWDALKLAVEEGNAEMAETVLIGCPGIINIPEEKKRGILAKAVVKGDMVIIEKLIAFGFRPDASMMNIARERKMYQLLEWCRCLRIN